MKNSTETALAWIIAALVIAALVMGGYGAVWWLYNHVVADMFGLPHFGYWKTVALILVVGFVARVVKGK